MKASLKNARISPKKMNLVAGLVRGKKTTDALTQLKFTPKKGADILFKVITSAVANATNNFDQKKDNLFIKTILVTKGVTYKRGIPVSRGRYHPILKRNSNIVVEIGLLDSSAPEKKAKKEEPKKEAEPKKDEVKKVKEEPVKKEKKTTKKPKKTEKAEQ